MPLAERATPDQNEPQSMPKRRVRISLAVKYRILFGLAVVLIIGAALYVPWHVMEALVLEQPFREAQRIADTHFRLTLGAAHDAAGSMHAEGPGLIPNVRGKLPVF